MPAGPLDEWLYSDWLLIARTLTKSKHDDCRCYDCDTIDTLLKDIAHYWDFDEHELVKVIGDI